MNYTYSTPQEAILSLEKAYSNNDLNAIIASKDFETEAKLMLEQTTYSYDLKDEEIIKETAKLLQLGLIKSLKENGFPNFNNLKTEFSEALKFRENIYVLNEKITYPDGTVYSNRIFVSKNDNLWRVVLIEE